MRAGTENIYGIVGFAKALELATANFEKDKRNIKELTTYMMEQLKNNFPSVIFNGDPCGNSLYTVISVSFPKSDNSVMLVFNLDRHDICASGGSACTAGAEGGSHVIKALGNTGQVTVRFSFCKNNTTKEVDYVLETLKQLF